MFAALLLFFVYVVFAIWKGSFSFVYDVFVFRIWLIQGEPGLTKFDLEML